MKEFNEKKVLDFIKETISKMEDAGPLKTLTILFDINDGSVKFYQPTEKNETDENVVKDQRELINCPNCDGDGYLMCELCNGNGYTILRTPIGTQNNILTCERCKGTGDVVCPDCNGLGKIAKPNENIENDIQNELIGKTIMELFAQTEHNTIIGPVIIPIAGVFEDSNGIYVVPDLKEHTLEYDEEIDMCLEDIQKQFGLEKPIVIPDDFFDNN